MIEELLNFIINEIKKEILDDDEDCKKETDEDKATDLFIEFLMALQYGRTEKLMELKKIEKTNDELKSSFSRKERRMLTKEAGIDKKLSAKISKYENAIEELDLIKNIVYDIYTAENDSEFEILIKYIWHFIISTEEIKNSQDYKPKENSYINTITFSEIQQILKNIIIESKFSDANCKFLSFFDENGNVLENKIIELGLLLERFYYSFEPLENQETTLTRDRYISLILDPLKLNEARKQEIQIAREKKEQEKLLKKQTREQKKLETQIMMEEQRKKSQQESPIKTKYDKKEVEKYFDLRSRDLKNNVIELISWEDLKPLLLEIPNITKNELSSLKKRYDYLYMIDKLARINKALSKNNATRFNELFKTNIDIQEEIKELIISDEFKTMTKSQIVTAVMNIINIEQSDTMTNFIIFTNPDLLQQSVEIVENASVENTDSLNRNIFHQLYLLQTQTLNELQKGGTATFHPLKYGTAQGGDFVLENGMKAYRFGKRKSKVCYFKASVCQENQEMLRKYYNINKSNDLLIVFGLGNVWSEPEIDLYNRCIEDANKDYETIEMIRKILSVPFTEESFKFITNLIDTANQQISDYRNKYNNIDNTLN